MSANLENAIHLGEAPAQLTRALRCSDGPSVGPWPFGADAQVLSALRATFWGRSPEEQAFDDRAAISQIAEGSNVVVWASSSVDEQAAMIDQLSLLPANVQVHAVQDSEAIGDAVLLDREAIEYAQALARAHGEGDPDTVSMLLPDAPKSMPYVAAAYQRLLEDLPDPKTGLTRTERQMLTVLRAAPVPRARVYLGLLPLEEHPQWTGDIYIHRILEEWERCAVPLVRRQDPNEVVYRSIYEITPAGIDALEGRLDHLAVNQIPRWFGGLRIPSEELTFRA